MHRYRTAISMVAALLIIGSFVSAHAEELKDIDIKTLSVQVMFSDKERTQAALKTLEKRGKQDVLDLNTGYRRDYGSGVVYRDYFASPELMFPAMVRDETRLKRKDYVFGIRQVGASKAWPMDAFRNRKVINDRVGDTNVVLIGEAATRTVRAYKRGDLAFAISATGLPGKIIWAYLPNSINHSTTHRVTACAGLANIIWGNKPNNEALIRRQLDLI